ncbi:YegP family protein [Actinosynnema sp. NPDC091369]
MKIHIDASGTQWYFRIVSSNGKVLAHSERYSNYADAKHAAELIKSQAGSAQIVG